MNKCLICPFKIDIISNFCREISDFYFSLVNHSLCYHVHMPRNVKTGKILSFLFALTAL